MNKHQAIADRWAGHECTLDNAPARIVGRLNEWATIASDGRSVEYSWPTVAHIMAHDIPSKRGRFSAR